MTNAATKTIRRDATIFIANGGRIHAAALHAAAVSAGRDDVAARIADVCSGRYLRYSGEDDDAMSWAWAELGWPRDIEVAR